MTTDLSRRALLGRTALTGFGLAVTTASGLRPGFAAAMGTAPKDSIVYHFYRNASAKLTYAGLTILLDPMLSPKGALPSFAGIASNPTVELPVPIAEIIDGIDAVIVSHLHEDHFDDAAARALPKDIPILTPHNASDVTIGDPSTRTMFKAQIEAKGFTNVREIARGETGSTTFRGITLHQVYGRHGKGSIGDVLGNVNGIVLQAPGEPTIYWAGDTVLDDDGEIEAVLSRFKPDIVIAHTGGPLIEAFSPEILLMDADQGLRFFNMAANANPNVQAIAVHMEALDHCFSTRANLKTALQTSTSKLPKRLVIPGDGDVVSF